MKRLTFLLLAGAMMICSYSHVYSQSSDLSFTVSGVFVNEDGTTRPDDDTYNVTVEIQNTNSTTANAIYSVTKEVTFQNGYFVFDIGDSDNPIDADMLSISSPNVSIELNDTKRFFSLTYVPYAIKAQLADDVLNIESDKVIGTFTNTTNIEANIRVLSKNDADTTIFSYDKDSGRFGIGTENPNSTVDVDGTIHSTTYFLNGVELSQALTWKPTNNTDVYLPESSLTYIGVGTTRPKRAIDVSGTINATTFLTSGAALTAGLEWKNPTDNVEDVYFNTTDGNVGIGYVNPSEKLDIRHGILIGNTTGNNEASIKWDTEDFMGYTPNGWRSLTGLSGVGVNKNIAMFEDDNGEVIDSLTHFTFDPDYTRLGLGTSFPQDRITIKTHSNETTGDAVIQVVTTENEHVFYVDGNGSMGVGTSDPQFEVDVNGLLNSEKILLGGVDFRNAIRSGTYWYYNDENIYYNLGNVGIGRPDANNKLEIAQPVGKDEIDPAITFALGDNSTETSASYTIGVDSANQGLFRVENGYDLGSNTPVFVSIDDRMGIGVEYPDANLHVSGNTGLIFGGNYLKALEDKTGTLGIADGVGVIPTEPMLVTGNGTRLMWYPPVGALRIGHLDEFAPLNGEDWNHTWRVNEYNDVGEASNVGKYSTVIGYNSVASGNFSTVIGGRQHEIGGAYSSAYGGQNLKTQGTFSMAMGSNVEANHHGSLIFGHRFIDQTGTTTENQVVILSKGVGIGTNKTSEAELSVGVDATENAKKVFSFENENGAVLSMFPSGNAVIGFPEATGSTAGLAVENSVAIATQNSWGGLTIDSTYLSATLTTENQAENIEENLIYNIITGIGIDSETTSPAFVVNNQARVGIGKYPDEDPRSIYVTSGQIAATGYQLPTGEELDGSAPVIVWNWEHATPNIFFPSGNIDAEGNIESTHNYVGIGTTSPNSLLELSYLSINTLGDTPAITFEQDEVDRFTVGVLSTAHPYFQINEGGSLAGTTPSMVVRDGVGIGISNPEAPLHVAKPAYFDWVGVDSENTTTKNLQVPSLNVFSLFIDGEIYSPAGVKWEPKESPDRIYYNNKISSTDFSFVGIKTMYPSAELEVSGNIDADDYFAKNYFKVQNDIHLDKLEFREVDADFIADLYVEDKELILEGSADKMSISAVISEGEATVLNPEGKMAFWVIPHPTGRRTFLTEADMLWNDIEKKLTLDGSYTNTYSHEFDTTGAYTNALKIGTPNFNAAMAVDVDVTHDGDHKNSFSHTAESIAIHVDEWPNALTYADTTPGIFKVNGVEILMNQPDGIEFSKNGEGIGLNVDVQNVSIQSEELGSEGHKYAALFQGQVGIGGTPNAELDVYGKIVAGEFNVTERLNMVTVNVSNGALFVENNVGIGTESPETELEVLGTIKATDVNLANGFESPLLNFENNVFSIQADGTIGLGTSSPTALLDLQKSFSSRGDDFSFKSITVTLNNSTPLDDNITLFESYITANNTDNYLGKDGDTAVKGSALSVDFSDLESEDDGYVVGVDITTVTGNTGTMYSAILMGGRVGIGTSEPVSSASMQVKGTIRAQNFPSTSFLTEQETASFNILAGTDAYFSNTATVYDLNVTELYQYEEMLVSETMDLPTLTFSFDDLISDVVSINGNISANNVVMYGNSTATSGSVSSLVVGTTGDYSATAYINGNMNTSTLNVLDLMLVNSVTANNTLYVSADTSRVGIGEPSPLHKLEINTDFGGTFLESDNQRWRNLYIQNTKNDTGQTGTAAGIEFSFTGSTAGIAAVSSTNSNVTGSSLVFITSATEDGDYSEKMRIGMDGNLGIGVTEPQQKLDVLGDMFVSGTVIGGDNITLTQLNVDSAVTISPSVNIYQDAEFNNKLYVDNLMIESRAATPSIISGYTNIFAAGENSGNLIFTTILENGSQITGNLTSTLTSDSNKLPYFGSDHLLSSAGGLYIYDSGVPSIEVGTKNSGAKFVQETYISTANSGIVNLNTIRMDIEKRTVAQTLGDTILSGLEVTVTKGATQAMIAEDDLFYGVNVDVGDLESKWQTDSGVSNVGFNYAAIFKGGSVKIGKQSWGLPSANVWVDAISSNASSANNSFWITSKDSDGNTDNALIVNPSGNVAIGAEDTSTDSTGAGKLLVTGINDGNSKSVSVINNSGTQIFSVINSGNIMIGSATPNLLTTGIETGETLTASTINVGTLEARKISMESDFYTADSGRIGFGTTVPEADFHYYRTITDVPDSNYSLSKGTITLEDPQTIDLYGLDMTFISSSNASVSENIFQSLADIPETLTATGMDVDITTLPSASVVTGVKINIDNNATTRNAAIFTGGYVGIGTSAPSDELTVVGSVNATTYVSAESISYINTAYFEELDVTSDIEIGLLKTYDAGILDTLYVELNSDKLRDLIAGTTLNVNVGLFANSATFDMVGVDATSDDANLYIDGKGIIDVATIDRIQLGSATDVINGSPNITIKNTIIEFPSTVNISDSIHASNGIKLEPKTSAPATYNTYYPLYVDSDNDLVATFKNDTTTLRAKISSVNITTTKNFLYFDSEEKLVSLPEFYWEEGDIDYYYLNGASLNISSTFNYEQTAPLASQKITMEFAPRTAASETNFYGEQIIVSGNQTFNANNIVAGIHADVSDIKAKYYAQNFGHIDSVKASAIFLGAPVKIGTDTANAFLHIAPTFNSTHTDATFAPALEIESGDDEGLLIGTLNIAMGAPEVEDDKLLRVKGRWNGYNSVALRAINSNDTGLFIRNSGLVGIGTNVPSSSLHIVTDTEAFAVSNNILFSDAEGALGVNTNSPEAQFHIKPYNNTNPVLKITSGNVNYVEMTPSGQVGINVSMDAPFTASDSVSLKIVGKLQSGDLNTGNSVQLVEYGQNSYGLAAISGSDDMYYGVSSNGHTYIAWGDSGNQSFKIQHESEGDLFIATANGTEGRIGYGTTAPDASFHVKQLDDDQSIFVLDGSVTYNLFEVASDGKIGLNSETGTSDIIVGYLARTVTTAMVVSPANPTDYAIRNERNNGTLMEVPILGLVNRNETTGVYSALQMPSENFLVSANVTGSGEFKGQAIKHIIKTEFTKDVIGLNVAMSGKGTEDQTNGNITVGNNYNPDNTYAASTEAFYGVRVDVSNVNTADPDYSQETGYGEQSGFKYPFGSQGGSVGIGTLTPSEDVSLHVIYGNNTDFEISSATMLSLIGEETTFKYKLNSTGLSDTSTVNAMEFIVSHNSTQDSPLYIGLEYDHATDGYLPVVGVGVVDGGAPTYNLMDKALVVSGDMYVGVKEDADLLEEAGYGSFLYFSGGPLTGALDGWNSDNSDTFYMARYNDKSALEPTRSISELRVFIGESEIEDPFAKMTIGHFKDETWDSVFTAKAFGIPEIPAGTEILSDSLDISAVSEPEGGVGIGTSDPLAALHVYGSPDVVNDDVHTNATSIDGNEVLVLLENNTSGNSILAGGHSYSATSSILSIQHDGFTATTFPDHESNFITFYTGTEDEPSAVGSIEGGYSDDYETGGTSFTSGGADYAEYIKKKNPKETMEPGDIIGIEGGLATKHTTNSQHFMIVSSSPLLVGNWQGKNSDEDMVLTAFLGQVPIKVKGQVRAGDYIVPSGKNDGYGIAVSPGKVTFHDVDKIVGRSWETSMTFGKKKVKAIVGFPFGKLALAESIKHLDELKLQKRQLETFGQSSIDKLQQTIDERQKLIDSLELEVSDLLSKK